MPISPEPNSAIICSGEGTPIESKYKQLIMGAALAAILLLIVVFPEAEAPVRITSLIGGCIIIPFRRGLQKSPRLPGVPAY